jgi:glycosyltransferase involved in cell wall biosynthesis
VLLDIDNRNNLSVAFMGCIYEKSIEDCVLSGERGFPQIAANNLGWLFADGLKYHLRSNLRLFSVLAVSSFPRFKKLFIRPNAWNSSLNASVTYISFFNIPVLKHFSILVSALLSLAPWVLSHRHKKKVLIIYSMYAPFPAIGSILARCFGVKTVLIVPDLPEFMRIGVKTPWLLRVASKLNRVQLYFFCRDFAGYVFLTKFMAERFKVDSERYVVIEGCVNVAEALDSSNKEVSEPSIRSLLYAGNLNEAYGVKMLIDGFRRLNNPSYRLWLCGAGSMKKDVEAACKADSRITYFGVVSKQKVQELSMLATALINPRTSSGEFTKYSFPSKIFEYLITGTPTIMCRLPGIPDEYFSYVYAIELESINGLSETIDYVLSLDNAQLERRGQAAKEYVIANKNNILQVGKLVELIKRLTS